MNASRNLFSGLRPMGQRPFSKLEQKRIRLASAVVTVRGNGHSVRRMAGIFLLKAFSIVAAISCFSTITSAQDQAAVEAGEQLYDDNCQQCHGEKLRNPGTSFDLRKFKADDRPRFNKFVMEGKGQMPAWQGTLSDGDIDAIWAYIRAHAYDK
jgi:mono/diheme cytochrome c family protein